MQENDVIVLNSHGVGQYAYCDRMPKWGETLSVKGWHVAEDGGKGSNVTVALGRLGVPTAYIGKVGCDPWGDLGEKWMREAGADTTYLYKDPNIATGTGLILVSPDGRNSIIDGDSSSAYLTVKEVTDAIDNLQGARFFIAGFEVPYKVALSGLRYAHDKGMITALNPSPLPDEALEALPYVDYLFVNEVEGEQLTGLSRDSNPHDLVVKIKEKMGAANVMLTLGDKGSCAIDSDNAFYEVPAIHVDKVVNTAGAGDGFMAATVACLHWGKSFEESLKWASYYSALCVTIDGTIPAYRFLEEVEQFIEEH